MSQINLDDFDNLKTKIFNNSPEVKEEYDKKKPLRDLQKEIIKARIERGLSQKELADMIDSTQSVISRLESADDYNPNLKTIIKVSKALNKKVDISLV